MACRRGGVAERASGRDVLDEQRAATKQAGVAVAARARRGIMAGQRTGVRAQRAALRCSARRSSAGSEGREREDREERVN